MALDELFEAVIVHREAPQHPHLVLLIWWAKRLSELGLTPSYGPGDHGNLSCRTKDGLLITARATPKANLHAEHFVEIVDVDQTASSLPATTSTGQAGLRVRCRGLRLPSTDTRLHFEVYQKRPDCQAIIHGHDASTMAKAHELKLPVTDRSAATPSVDLITEVCQLVRNHDYVLLRDHGFLALGRSIDEAGELVRRLCARARSL